MRFARAGGGGRSVELFRMRGIPIYAHWSLPLAMIGTLFWLVGTLLPARYPTIGGGAIALMAVASVVLFMGSVLLHEMGHATQDIREGGGAGHITLHFFGGVAYGTHPRSPAADARVTGAGPLVSAVLALSFGVLAWVADLAGVTVALRGVALLLFQINAGLLAVNLLPIFPLDGGRLLRAWLWRRWHDRRDATLTAARTGQIVAGMTILFGGLAPFTGVISKAYDADAVFSGPALMVFGALGLYLALQAEDEAEGL